MIRTTMNAAEHPVDEKFYEWELEDVEANIEVELWVLIEILAVSKQDPVCHLLAVPTPRKRENNPATAIRNNPARGLWCRGTG